MVRSSLNGSVFLFYAVEVSADLVPPPVTLALPSRAAEARRKRKRL